MKITEMQFIILACIHEYIYENDKTPTIRDIAYDLEKSTSTIYYHLKKMKEEGIVNFNEKGRITTICQN